MDTRPPNRAAEEIVKNAPVKEYEAEIAAIVKSVEARGFRVAPRYDEDETSLADWNNNLIRISLRDKDRGIAIIWDLLHELGHLLDGHPHSDHKLIMEREISAWDNAREKIKEYPRLATHPESFEQRREWCLKSYERKFR